MSENKQKYATTILLILYCIFLIWAILFKFATPSQAMMLRTTRGINLVPFDFENQIFLHFLEVMFNFIIFAPFGFLLRKLDVRILRVVIIGFLFSLIFEVTQYAMCMGISDITDLITNTLGAAWGAGIYKTAAGLNRKK